MKGAPEHSKEHAIWHEPKPTKEANLYCTFCAGKGFYYGRDSFAHNCPCRYVDLDAPPQPNGLAFEPNPPLKNLSI